MNSETSSTAGNLLFTVESATRTLPLVGAIVGDLTRLYKKVVDRRARLDMLRDERPTPIDADDPYSQELAQIEQELDKDGRELERFMTELDDLGVAARNSIKGAVGFPAMIDGRLIELSWMLGEAGICHYHEVGGDPEDRQPLEAFSI